MDFQQERRKEVMGVGRGSGREGGGMETEDGV